MALAPIDDLRRRFRAASNRRALDELRHEVARQIRQTAEDTADDGSMSESSQALFDALKAMLAEIDAKTSRQAVIDDLDTRNARRDRSDRTFDDGLYGFSLRGMIAASIGSPIPGLDIGRSMEISQELRNRPGRSFQGFAAPIEALSLRGDYARRLERRADVISTGLPPAGPGGSLIANVLDGSRYVDALRSRTVVRAAGAQIISGVVGNLDIPRLSRTGSVGWFLEGESVIKTDEAFDRVSFRPKHCGAISTYSRNMLLQSTPDIEMVIRDDLSKLLALEIDRVALVGTGQGAEPLGIANNPLCAQVPAGPFSYQNSVALRAKLTSKNAPLESLAFVGNSTIDAWALSTEDAIARPLGEPIVFLGLPYYVTNVATFAGLPAGSPVLPAAPDPLFFGAWSDMWICFWSELDILPNATADSVYASGAVMVRALMTADVNLRHPESFAFCAVSGPPAVPTAP